MKRYDFLNTKSVAAVCVSSMLLLCSTAQLTAGALTEETTDFTLNIVHTNDIHSRVEENAKSGIIGIERLGSIIEEMKNDCDMDLVLDSGDLFHGQSIATLVEGESVAQLIRECGYDAMTAGNHDWSYGKDRLKELAATANLKMLTGNVRDENGDSFFDDEYYTEEVTKNGVTLKVGVFGVSDPSMKNKTAPSNVEGLDFTDSLEYSQNAAAELKDSGCDFVIALTHTYSPEKLAENVNGVDLWLCGHEHEEINKTVKTPDGSTSYIYEDSCYLYQAGIIKVDCSLDSEGNITAFECSKNPVDYNASLAYEKKPSVTSLLESIKAEQNIILNKQVGTSPENLDGVWEHLRIDETNLGRAVTDAYLLATGADIAFENAGGIRASINAGDVTYGDIISVSPYGNYIVTKKVTGAQLKEILETSIEIQMQNIAANESGDWNAWPSGSGSYLQAGGITVEYNPSLSLGNRVISVKVGTQPLDENRLYTVATNNYAAESDLYPQLANADEEGEFSACDEALIKFFEQSEDKISASVNTARMIKTTKTTDDTKPTVPSTTPTSTAEPTTAATSQSTTAAPAQSVTQPANNSTSQTDGKTVKTGSENNTVTYAAAIISGGISFAMLFAKRRRKNNAD